MQKKVGTGVVSCAVLDHLSQSDTKNAAEVINSASVLEISPKNPSSEEEEIVLEAEEEGSVPDLKNDSDNAASELYFERETSILDFEREAVYDVDSFEKKSTRAEKLLAPPPDFQKSLKALSPDLKKNFKTILNGDIVGIWPIKQNFLLK